MAAIRRDDRLKGKVAIVTGAGSRAEGIGNGRATAVILARHGAQVTLVDSVAQWAEETKRLIEAEGGVSQIVEGDVSDPASCQAIVARTVEPGAGSTFSSTMSASPGRAATPSRSMSRHGTARCASMSPP
jgi:NAD(P)-dependent dehydrogenase (short-subunit alcohol dehydrogenase family)